MGAKLVRLYAPANEDITVNVSEAEAAAWSALTAYMINSEVVHDHKVFVSTTDDNLGIDPSGETQESPATSRWLLKGATNAWSFLDGVSSNPTEAAGPLEISIDNISGVDTLILFGVYGTSYLVEGFNTSGSKVYESAGGLTGREVANWWQWFFEPFSEYSDKVTLTDVPAAVTRIDVTIEGDTVTLGELVLGDFVSIGDAQRSGTNGQSVTFSRIEFNVFGRLNLVKRPTRIDMKYRIHTARQHFNMIKPILDRSAGSIVAVIGREEDPSTVHFGVLDVVDWDEGIPNSVFYSFTLRGMI